MVGNPGERPYCQGMGIRDRCEYALFLCLVGVLRLLPYRAAERLLRLAGAVAARCGWWRADTARAQLAAAFPAWPPARLQATLAAHYDHLARTAAEVFRADPRTLRQRVEVPGGWGPLEAALAEGRGVILAAGHLGNFELCGRVIAARCDLLDVVKPQRNPLFDRHLDRLRARHGIRTVPMDLAGKAVLRHLRRGQVVALLLDQDAGARGVATEFLGRPASTWPGAARLSLRTGCPVLPVCLVRHQGGRHALHFGSVLYPPPTAATSADIQAYTQRITDALAAFLCAHPEQWFWVHRRWKGGQVAFQPREPAS